MRNDYAKYISTQGGQSPLKKWLKRLMALALGIFMLVIFGYFSYLFYFKQKLLSSPAIAVTKKQQEPKFLDEKLDIKFSFYNDLPSMEMGVLRQAPVPDKSRKIEQIIKKTVISQTHTKKQLNTYYMVQIAAFKNSSSASDMRIALLFEGFEVDIIESKKNNHKIFYLQQGPYPSVAKARVAQQKLAKQGFDSVIKKTIT